MNTDALMYVGGPPSEISGTGFPVKAGTHTLKYEILGVKGAVLATSAAYTVTVPKQAAAVKPKLTFKAPGSETYEGFESIDISTASAATLDASSWVLTFTVPAGATIVAGQTSPSGTASQSGTS